MDRQLKLLILTHNYPRFAGDFAGVFISLLARRLAEHGIDPVLLAPHDPGAAEKETADGVTVYRFRYAKDDRDETIAYRGNMHQLVLGSVTGIFKFKQFLDSFRTAAFEIIRNEKIDVVAGNWLVPSGIVMKTIAAKTKLPLVLSSHGTDIRLMTKYLGISRRYFRSFFPQLSRWTVVSSFLRDEIIRMEPELASILEVLPLPHDETVFYRDESVTRDPHLVVSVTRFTDQKRPDILVKSFALLNEKIPASRLEIYGSGPRQAEIEQLIAKLGLQDRVQIIPPVPQTKLREIYNRAGIVVLNSFQEGFGLALSEAMLCGASVIGAASGGIVDIIRHNETGLLVEVDNSASLAEAMHTLLTDESQRERLANAGYRYARENYASGPLAVRFANLIKKASERKRQ
jgi:glycosyltransferase involved in cell wall biosynthesis